jgi:hypothetical protein
MFGRVLKVPHVITIASRSHTPVGKVIPAGGFVCHIHGSPPNGVKPVDTPPRPPERPLVLF